LLIIFEIFSASLRKANQKAKQHSTRQIWIPIEKREAIENLEREKLYFRPKEEESSIEHILLSPPRPPAKRKYKQIYYVYSTYVYKYICVVHIVYIHILYFLNVYSIFCIERLTIVR